MHSIVLLYRAWFDKISRCLPTHLSWAGEVVNGKLYLNNSQRALDIFNKDQSVTIAKAKSNWPTVKNKAL